MASKKSVVRSAKKRRAEVDITDEIIEKPVESLEIRPFKWTQKQEVTIDLALDKNTKVLIIKSVAGTGKTLLSMFCALTKLKEKTVNGIVYVRCPVESSAHKIGFLPSFLEDKMAPYAEPAISVMREMILEREINQLRENGSFLAYPVGYLKGLSFHNKVVFCDEVEDLDLKSLTLLLTRVGRGSLLILAGDMNQVDVKSSGFSEIYNLFNDEESKKQGIHCVEFDKTDCMRSGIVKFILGKTEGLK